MRAVPDWQIQLAWWASGIFATGAAWYFLSTSNVTLAAISGAVALAFAGVAIVLHRKKDQTSEPLTEGRSESARFERLFKLMPELLSEFRNDLLENREHVLREFVFIANERIQFNHGQPRIEIYETKHPAAKNQVGVLVSEGFVEVVRSTGTPIYRMTENFVQRLEHAV